MTGKIVFGSVLVTFNNPGDRTLTLCPSVVDVGSWTGLTFKMINIFKLVKYLMDFLTSSFLNVFLNSSGLNQVFYYHQVRCKGFEHIC